MLKTSWQKTPQFGKNRVTKNTHWQDVFQVRPDLCATDCDIPPRDFLGKIWTDSLVHDDAALRLLVEVIVSDLSFCEHSISVLRLLVRFINIFAERPKSYLISRLLERIVWFSERIIPFLWGRCRLWTPGLERWIGYKQIQSNKNIQSKKDQELPHNYVLGYCRVWIFKKDKEEAALGQRHQFSQPWPYQILRKYHL